MEKPFQKYARYYDLIYKDKDYEGECDFIEGIFQRFLPVKPKVVLDIACGTGGHAIPLAKRGYAVTGIDGSQEMIGTARENAKRAKVAIDFEVMAMQDFKLDGTFDAAICMFSSMDYLLTYEDIEKTLNNVNSHLKRGSIFTFDFWNGLAVLRDYSPVRVRVSEDGSKRVLRFSTTKVNALQQICEVTFKCLALDNGKVVDEFEEKHLIRFFFVEECKYLLQKSGYEVLAMCPFLGLGQAVTETDWNVTAVARAL